MTAILTLEQANQIIQATLVHAREAGYPPLTVTVVDASGHPVAMQREDAASMFRFDISRAKAWGSVAMGVPSRTLFERGQENPNFFVALAATADGQFLPQPGGVLIRSADGHLLGAVGASGGTGDEDEAACVAGVRGAGLLPDPD